MNKDKPRIAFCFSWQARTLDQTYLFFQKNLFDAAEEQWFEYDVFCAVEDDEDWDKVNLLNPVKVEKIKSSEVEKIIKNKIYENDKIDINKYAFMKKTAVNPDMITSHFQQLYKICKSINLLDKNYSYNVVVRLRYDCFFFNKLDFKKIEKIIWDSLTLICNTSMFKFSNVLSKIHDFYFIWNEKSIKILGRIFDNYIEWFQWDEIKNVVVYKISTKIRDCIFKVNNILWTWIIPITPIRLFESCFYKVFTPEIHIYNFLIKNQIKIIDKKFSYILLRKNIQSSWISLHDKNEYEI